MKTLIPAKGWKGVRSWGWRRLTGAVLDALFEKSLIRADVDDTPIPARIIAIGDTGTILRTPHLLRTSLHRIFVNITASETRLHPRTAWRPENILSYQNIRARTAQPGSSHNQPSHNKTVCLALW